MLPRRSRRTVNDAADRDGSYAGSRPSEDRGPQNFDYVETTA